MAGFADNDVQKLLQQAEERLSGGRIVPKQASTASTTAKPVGEDAKVLPSKQEKTQVRVPRPQVAASEQRKGKNTAGPEWFDLPKTDLTPEFKRDWQLLRMRNVLDPKQQRKALRASAPVYSQVGRIIASPTDPYSARLGSREKKKTLSESIMSAHNDTKLASKYSSIQETKRQGRKAFYKSVVAKRRKRN
ncbi:fcf2 pre-rRNA processing domain-containing protein [Trichoderma breve]|uniref:Fcf2 pre-rRNA processing domain-containing protein n=1 Tax=Trichoderma breve TaxID=2034170 RepID=A0A9W9E2I2_9HYPO|nr:fcf2 pre-rRNA processing domain-containing protein [Trichoderma breve]KAJ4855469.1 fcf2 pre-rRNA processing domain-containing protein [Trichoderma breve]